MERREKMYSPKLVVRGIPLAKVGTFKDSKGKTVTFSKEELEKTATVNNACISEGRDQPLVLTHEDNDLALKNNEVYGHANSYYVEGDVLYFDLDVAEGKEKYVKRGDKRMLSMARFPKTGEIYHIAFTGRQAIPIANMKFGTFEEFSDENDMEIVELLAFEGLEKEDEGMKETLEKLLEAFKAAKDDKSDNGKISALEAEIQSFKDAQTAALTSAQSEIETLKQAKAEAERIAKEATQAKKDAEVTAKLEQYSAAGAYLPSQAESAKKLMEADAEAFEAFLKENKLVDFSAEHKAEEFKAVDEETKEILTEEEKSNVQKWARTKGG
jgi:hypothetical protein